MNRSGLLSGAMTEAQAAPAEGGGTVLSLTERALRRWLIGAIAVLLAGQIGVVYSTLVFGHDSMQGILWLFTFGRESNIPTWYTAVLLLASAGAAFLCLQADGAGRRRRYWTGLVIIFLYLSVDEAAEIHELVGRLATFIKATGVLYYRWVLPFGLLALAIGCVYLRFLFLLPRDVALLFFVGGVLYVAGAIGFEILGALEAEAFRYRNLPMLVYVTIEETFEMGGPSLFLYGAHRYLQRAGASVRLVFHGD